MTRSKRRNTLQFKKSKRISKNRTKIIGGSEQRYLQNMFFERNTILLLYSERKEKRLELLKEKSKELELHKMIKYLINEFVFSYKYEDILEIFSFYDNIDFDTLYKNLLSLKTTITHKQILQYFQYIFTDGDYHAKETVKMERYFEYKKDQYDDRNRFNHETYNNTFVEKNILFNFNILLRELIFQNHMDNISRLDIFVKLFNMVIQYVDHTKEKDLLKSITFDLNQWSIQNIIDINLDDAYKIQTILYNKKKNDKDKVREYIMNLKPIIDKLWTKKNNFKFNLFNKKTLFHLIDNYESFNCNDLVELGLADDYIPRSCINTWTIRDFIERNYDINFIFNYLFNHSSDYEHEKMKDYIIEYISKLNFNALKKFVEYKSNKMTTEEFQYIYKKSFINLTKKIINNENEFIKILYKSGISDTVIFSNYSGLDTLQLIYDNLDITNKKKFQLDIIFQIFKPDEIPYDILTQIIECPIKYKNDYVKFVIDTLKTSIFLPLKSKFKSKDFTYITDFKKEDCLLCKVPSSQFVIPYYNLPPYIEHSFVQLDSQQKKKKANSLYVLLGIPNKWKKYKKKFGLLGKETNEYNLNDTYTQFIDKFDESKKGELFRYVLTNLNINILNLYTDYKFPYEELVKHKDDFIELQNHIYENRIYFKEDDSFYEQSYPSSFEEITKHTAKLNEYHEKQNEFIQNKRDYVSEFFIKYPKNPE